MRNAYILDGKLEERLRFLRCTCVLVYAGGYKIDFKIGLQGVVWIYMALVRDQGQTLVTFGLRRS
jgi:hypothetical protein